MSLGENTKCDLSLGLAKLDLQVLTKQIENHYFSLLKELKNKTEEVINDSLSFTNRKKSLLSMASHGSKTIRQLSEQIAETTELLYTLYNIENREIEIIR